MAVLEQLRLFSVPLNSEEGRSLLQRRIAFFAQTAWLVSLAFFVGANLVTIAFGAIPLRFALMHPPNWCHAGAIVASLAVWLVARRGNHGRRALFLLDFGGTLVAMGLYSAMAALEYRDFKVRVDMLLLLIVMLITTLRATIVPSTPLHTALVSTVAAAPAVAVGWIVGKDLGAAGGTIVPVYSAFWGAASVFAATLASRVTYGLRARAADAMRLGQYVLETKIGEGGMGSVYLARHALLRRPTAIKLVQPSLAGEEAVSRFEREGQHTSRLTHPNTVAIYDYGRTPEGVFYYAMEYLDGLDLQKLVERFGPQDPSRVVHVLEQVCAALAEAHEQGIVHRDIKPANVILCERGGILDVAKVVDFGLAKDVAGGDPQLSQANAIIGTPLYMAPETITSPETVDARSDLYSLGVVGYFLLAGQPVFSGKSFLEICGQHLHEAPPPPSSKLDKALPTDLERLVLRCLSKKREDRPQSARALRDELVRCAIEPWTEERARAWWRENKARADAQGSPASIASGPTVVAIDLVTRG